MQLLLVDEGYFLSYIPLGQPWVMGALTRLLVIHAFGPYELGWVDHTFSGFLG